LQSIIGRNSKSVDTTGLSPEEAKRMLWQVKWYLLSYGPIVLVLVVVVLAVVLIVKSRSKPKTGQPPSQQAAAAPGWYTDPNHPNLMRYFDGRAWTSETTPRK
jgi:hypothetical protein